MCVGMFVFWNGCQFRRSTQQTCIITAIQLRFSGTGGTSLDASGETPTLIGRGLSGVQGILMCRDDFCNGRR